MDLQFYNMDGDEIDVGDAARLLYSMEAIEVDGEDFTELRVRVSYDTIGTHWDDLDVDEEGFVWPEIPFHHISFELYGDTLHVM